MPDAKLLATYLNDHLAAATAGVELAKRTAGSNEGTELGSFLTRLAVEIEEDRDTLLAVMRSVEAKPDRIKVAAGWSAEKAGRLKLNGRLFSYSPLSRVNELEGLSLGVEGKAALWQALSRLADPRLAEFDFDDLLARAQRQRDQLHERRVSAAVEAFAG